MAIPDFLELMPETVTLAAPSSTGAYGEITYASGVDYRARVVRKPISLTGGSNEDILAGGMVWIGPPTADLTSGTLPTVTVEDKITLPDGDTPKILRVDKMSDESGYHHIKVYFG